MYRKMQFLKIKLVPYKKALLREWQLVLLHNTWAARKKLLVAIVMAQKVIILDSTFLKNKRIAPTGFMD